VIEFFYKEANIFLGLIPTNGLFPWQLLLLFEKGEKAKRKTLPKFCC